jgi:single-strand DNA-binding protein
MNLNKAIIVGRVTANPELRRTPGGTSVSAFSIATNRVWTDKVKGKQEEVEFHNIVAWGRQAEIASQYLTKGAMVMVEGRLKTRSWADKQGANHKTTEIICEVLQLGPKAAGGGGPSGASGTWSSKPQSGGADLKGEEAPQANAAEEIPVINLDEEPEQGADEIPF